MEYEPKSKVREQKDAVEKTETVPSPFKVCYQVQDVGLYSQALGRLPEFTRGSAEGEYIWLAPMNGLATKPLRPVATLKVSGQTVEIESQSRRGLQAMQILVEELGGKTVRLVSSVSAQPKV